jgi:LysM repeat protein
MKSLHALSAPLSILLLSCPLQAETEVERLQSLCRAQATQIATLESALAALQHQNSSAIQTVESKVESKQKFRKSTDNTSTKFHVVKSGDSLTKISRQYGLSLRNLASLNGIKTSAVIHPGQRLKVAAHPERSVAESTLPKAQCHNVKAGDTCSSISKKYGISPDALLAANPGLDPTKLQVGQKILLGGSSDASKAAAKPTPVATAIAQANQPVAFTENLASPQQTSAEAPPSAQGPKLPEKVDNSPKPEVAPTPKATTEQRPKSIVIENEISYGDFANQHGTDPDRLNDLNGLDLASAAVLARGSELYVPAQP